MLLWSQSSVCNTIGGLLAIIIAVVAIVAVVLALNGTRWGLNLKATGRNARSALLLGVPVTTSSLGAMALCGALAGIGGAHRLDLARSIGEQPQRADTGDCFTEPGRPDFHIGPCTCVQIDGTRQRRTRTQPRSRTFATARRQT